MTCPVLPREAARHWHEPWRYAHASWRSGEAAPPGWACFADCSVAGQRLGWRLWFDHHGIADPALVAAPPVAVWFSVEHAALAATWTGLLLCAILSPDRLQRACREALSAGLAPAQVKAALALARSRHGMPVRRWPGDQQDVSLCGLGVWALQAGVQSLPALDWHRLAWGLPASGVAQAAACGRCPPPWQHEEEARAIRQLVLGWNAGCHVVAMAQVPAA